jgi:hypothetical protein
MISPGSSTPLPTMPTAKKWSTTCRGRSMSTAGWTLRPGLTGGGACRRSRTRLLLADNVVDAASRAISRLRQWRSDVSLDDDWLSKPKQDDRT